MTHHLVLLVGVNRQLHDGIGEAIDRAEVQRPGDGVDQRINTALARMTIALYVQSTLTNGCNCTPQVPTHCASVVRGMARPAPTKIIA